MPVLSLLRKFISIACRITVLKSRASTLIENLVALMILSIIISMSLMLIVRLQEKSSAGFKMHAQYSLQAYADSSVENRLTDPGTWDEPDLHLVRSSEPCKINSLLTVLHFSALNNDGTMLAEESAVVESKADEKN